MRADKGTEKSSVQDIHLFFRQNVESGGDRSFIYSRSTTNERKLVRLLEEEENAWNFGHFDGDFLDENLVLFCFLSLIQVKGTEQFYCPNRCMHGYDL